MNPINRPWVWLPAGLTIPASQLHHCSLNYSMHKFDQICPNLPGLGSTLNSTKRNRGATCGEIHIKAQHLKGFQAMAWCSMQGVQLSSAWSAWNLLFTRLLVYKHRILARSWCNLSPPNRHTIKLELIHHVILGGEHRYRSLEALLQAIAEHC